MIENKIIIPDDMAAYLLGTTVSVGEGKPEHTTDAESSLISPDRHDINQQIVDQTMAPKEENPPPLEDIWNKKLMSPENDNELRSASSCNSLVCTSGTDSRHSLPDRNMSPINTHHQMLPTGMNPMEQPLMSESVSLPTATQNRLYSSPATMIHQTKSIQIKPESEPNQMLTDDLNGDKLPPNSNSFRSQQIIFPLIDNSNHMIPQSASIDGNSNRLVPYPEEYLKQALLYPSRNNLKQRFRIGIDNNTQMMPNNGMTWPAQISHEVLDVGGHQTAAKRRSQTAFTTEHNQMMYPSIHNHVMNKIKRIRHAATFESNNTNHLTPLHPANQVIRATYNRLDSPYPTTNNGILQAPAVFSGFNSNQMNAVRAGVTNNPAIHQTYNLVQKAQLMQNQRRLKNVFETPPSSGNFFNVQHASGPMVANNYMCPPISEIFNRGNLFEERNREFYLQTNIVNNYNTYSSMSNLRNPNGSNLHNPGNMNVIKTEQKERSTKSPTSHPTSSYTNGYIHDPSRQ